MNAPTATRPTTPTRLAQAPAVPARAPAVRTFGTGYGRSSGYAAQRSYASAPGLAAFRFA